MSLIDLNNISKIYPYDENHYDTGIKNISLSVNHGDFIAIQGHSGSGKTTLLNILGCIDIPSSGTYYFNQKPISEYSSKQLSQFRLSNIGLVFQSFHLLRNRSIIDNVSLPLLYAGYSKWEAKLKSQILIEAVGLMPFENKIVKNLSGGQQQRVAIARAIINTPQLILADEPTGNLDEKNGDLIYELLKEINAKNHTTVLIATHDTRVNKYTDRIIYMSEGEIVSLKEI